MSSSAEEYLIKLKNIRFYKESEEKRNKRLRLAIENFDDKSFDCNRCLFFPFINGINMLPDAQGFSDKNYISYDLRKRHEKELLLRCLELFYGIIAQKALGTPEFNVTSKNDIDRLSKKMNMFKMILADFFQNGEKKESECFCEEFSKVWKEFIESNKYIKNLPIETENRRKSIQEVISNHLKKMANKNLSETNNRPNTNNSQPKKKKPETLNNTDILASAMQFMLEDSDLTSDLNDFQLENIKEKLEIFIRPIYFKRSEDDKDIDIEDEDQDVVEEPQGFVMVVHINDPNWDAKLAIKSICNNTQVHLNPPKKIHFTPNPWYSNWVDKTSTDHVGRYVQMTTWNKLSAEYKNISNINNGCDNDDDNHDSDNGADLQKTLKSRTEKIVVNSSNSKVYNDPLLVFNYENCAYWLDHYGINSNFLHDLTFCEFNLSSQDYYYIPYEKISFDQNRLNLMHYYLPWKKNELIDYIEKNFFFMKNKYGDKIQISIPDENGLIENFILGVKPKNVGSELLNYLKKQKGENKKDDDFESFNEYDVEMVKDIIEFIREKLDYIETKAEDVYKTIIDTMKKLLGDVSSFAENNSLIKLLETLRPILDLVEGEKPSLNFIKEITPDFDYYKKNSYHEAWFSNKTYEKKSKRYIEIRRNFEILAFKKYLSIINDKTSILTKPMRSIIDYTNQKKDIITGKNIFFFWHDTNMGSLGNFLEMIVIRVCHIFNIAGSMNAWVRIFLAAFDATRYHFGLHANVLLTGDPGASKSHILIDVTSKMIEGTVVLESTVSLRALTTNEDHGDAITYADEVLIGGGGKNGNKNGDERTTQLKSQLSNGFVYTYTCCVTSHNEFGSLRFTLKTVTNTQGVTFYCGNTGFLEAALHDRFMRIIFGKLQIKKDVKENLSDIDVENLQKIYDLYASSGTSAFEISNVTDKYLSQKNLEKNLETLCEDRELDDLLANKLPEITVNQAMFLDSMYAPKSSAFKRTNDRDGITNQVQIIQSIVARVFKMISIGCLPEVDTSLTDAITLKLMNKICKNGNIKQPSPRVPLRIVIMARILCIFNAILQVFTGPNSDYPEDLEISDASLYLLKPYLFCDFQQSILAFTLLLDEIVGPFDLAAIGAFGHVICKYPTSEKLQELFFNYKGLLEITRKFISKLSNEYDPYSLMKKVLTLMNKKSCDSKVNEILQKIQQSSPFTISAMEKTRRDEISPDVDMQVDDFDIEDEVSLEQCQNVLDPKVIPIDRFMDRGGEIFGRNDIDDIDDDVIERLMKIFGRLKEGKLHAHEIYSWVDDVNSTIEWDRHQSNVPKEGLGFNMFEQEVDLNYLSVNMNMTELVSSIISSFSGLTPSFADLLHIINCLKKNYKKGYYYKKNMTKNQIKSIEFETLDELVDRDLMVKTHKPIIVTGSKDKRNVIKILIRALDNQKDIRTLVTNSIKDLIYQGMKPNTYLLGIMSNNNRARFSVLKITEKDIEKSKRKTFSMKTGETLTRREKIMISEEEIENWHNESSQNDENESIFSENKNSELLDEIGEDTIKENKVGEIRGILNELSINSFDEKRLVSDWIKYYFKKASKENYFQIECDLDDWIARKYFLSVGIPMVYNVDRPIWLYELPDIEEFKENRIVFKKDYEKRELPTNYYQKMRAIYYSIDENRKLSEKDIKTANDIHVSLGKSARNRRKRDMGSDFTEPEINVNKKYKK